MAEIAAYLFVVAFIGAFIWMWWRIVSWAVRPYTSGEYSRNREYLRLMKLEAAASKQQHLEQLREKYRDL